MKTIEYQFGGKPLHLYMNGEAMFAIEALDDSVPEDTPSILDVADQNTAAGYEALCKIAVILATQGEHCRRYLHYTPERIPTEKELLLLLSPIQMLGLRAAVYRAINDGYGKASQDDDGDIDTGLAELEKKTKL